MQTHDRRISSRGHTLLEIMIVVALVAAAGLLAVGNLRRQMPAYRLEHATTQLVTDLTSARMRAISQAMPATVTINEDTRTYSVWVDANTNGVADADEQEQRSLDNVRGLTLKATSATLTFSPRGRLPGVNLYWISKLNIREAGTHYVYVLPGGQVRASRKHMDWTYEDGS